LFTKLQATRGSEAGHVHYYTRIRAVIYGYARHLFGTQVCERRCGERDRAEETRKRGLERRDLCPSCGKLLYVYNGF